MTDSHERTEILFWTFLWKWRKQGGLSAVQTTNIPACTSCYEHDCYVTHGNMAETKATKRKVRHGWHCKYDNKIVATTSIYSQGKKQQVFSAFKVSSHQSLLTSRYSQKVSYKTASFSQVFLFFIHNPENKTASFSQARKKTAIFSQARNKTAFFNHFQASFSRLIFIQARNKTASFPRLTSFETAKSFK